MRNHKLTLRLRTAGALVDFRRLSVTSDCSNVRACREVNAAGWVKGEGQLATRSRRFLVEVVQVGFWKRLKTSAVLTRQWPVKKYTLHEVITRNEKLVRKLAHWLEEGTWVCWCHTTVRVSYWASRWRQAARWSHCCRRRAARGRRDARATWEAFSSGFPELQEFADESTCALIYVTLTRK